MGTLYKSWPALSYACTVPVGSSLDDCEKEAIVRTLKFYDGNKTQTAKVLKIGLTTLYRKLHQYGMVDGDEPQVDDDAEASSDPNAPEGADSE